MNADMKAAARHGDIEGLYTLIENDPYVLESIDKIPFVDTPLHTAASADQIRFVTEIMKLKPSFARKLNPQGLSPMHLALQNEDDHMVFRLVSIDKELVRVKGQGDLTPLHLAAKIGLTEILVEFLTICPDSIHDVTIEGETALHVAVKNPFEVLQVLVGWLWRNSYASRRSILNRKNESGDTILHVAARLNDEQIVGFLTKKGFHLNEKNEDNKTALDMVEELGYANVQTMLLSAKAKRGTEVDAKIQKKPKTRVKMLEKPTGWIDEAAFFMDEISVKLDDNTRNALLVVAVLIATMAYQSALSPPGGLSQASDSRNSTYNATFSVPAASAAAAVLDSSTAVIVNIKSAQGGGDDPQGKSAMAEPYFIPFWILNTICLFGSTLVIFVLLPAGVVSSTMMATLTVFSLSYLYNTGVITSNEKLKIFHLVFMDGVLVISVVLVILKKRAIEHVRQIKLIPPAPRRKRCGWCEA